MPVVLRWGLPAGILMLSLGHAAAVDLGLLTDSRYAAEAWFTDHVKPPSSVGAFSKPQYLPRLNDLGFATYSLRMTPETFEQPQPEFLVLTSFNYEDFDARQRACMNELLTGRLGYNRVAEFSGEPPAGQRSWLSVAGWGAPRPGKISPTIMILRRDEP